MSKSKVGNKTICLPFETEEHYQRCMNDPEVFVEFIHHSRRITIITGARHYRRPVDEIVAFRSICLFCPEIRQQLRLIKNFVNRNGIFPCAWVIGRVLIFS